MFKTFLAGLLIVAGAISAPSRVIADETFTFAPTKSRIEFHANATFTKVIGVFHAWQADLKIPSGRLENATLNMEIQAGSVRTGSGLKDNQVKGNNFFDVLAHPLIRFNSTRILPGSGPNQYLMEGDLTLRGITKPVTVGLTLQPGADGHQTLLGKCYFNRREFGMVHNVPFNKVADNVSVTFQFDLSSGGLTAASTGPIHTDFNSAGR